MSARPSLSKRFSPSLTWTLLVAFWFFVIGAGPGANFLGVPHCCQSCNMQKGYCPLTYPRSRQVRSTPHRHLRPRSGKMRCELRMTCSHGLPTNPTADQSLFFLAPRTVGLPHTVPAYTLLVASKALGSLITLSPPDPPPRPTFLLYS